MKLSSREDIDAPLEAAFAAVTDFDYLERQILRRGIQIVRTDSLETPGPGMGWEAEMDWRATPYDVRCDLVGWTPPSEVEMKAASGGIDASVTAHLTALSKNSTRMRVALTLKGASFRDRMLLQSLKLAKARLSRQFCDLVRHYAEDAGRRAAA